MTKYLRIIDKWIVTIIFALIMLGIIRLLNIDFNGKRYIGMVLVSVLVWALIDIIKIKRSR